ncbi:unnamed protein product [Ixodes hexagonus]
MAVARASSLLLTFKTKIEESVALVPAMVAEEKLKAVQFWNVVSERLQEIVNDSAADINALALKMQKHGMTTASLDDQGDQTSGMTPQYMESHSYGSGNIYAEPVQQYSVGETTTAPSHEQEYLELPVELESVAATQPVPTQGSFHNVPLEPQRLNGMGSTGTEPSVDSNTSILMPMCNARPQECFELPQQDQNPSGLVPGGDIRPELVPPPVKATESEKTLKKETAEDVNWEPETHAIAPKQKTASKKPTKKAAPKSNARSTDSKDDETGEKWGQSTDISLLNCTIESEEGVVSLIKKVPDPQGSADGKSQDVDTTEVIVIQTKKKPKKWKEMKECEVCLKKIPASALTTHMWTHRKPFSCTECNASFSTKSNLVVHQRRHSGEKPYMCFECNASFSTRGNLKRHVKTHSGVKPWECTHCGGRFTEKKTLKVHMRRHTGEKPYQCQICQRRFAQNGILQTHMAMHLGQKSHLCEHCGKAFRQRSQLRLHTLRHQGVRKYNCATCPSKFLTKGDLERHNRMHTGERPFACDLCGKSFTRQQSLNEHTNRHYGIKPYECKRCGKTFAEMSACYKHIKAHSKSGGGTGPEDIHDGMKVNTHAIPELAGKTLEIVQGMDDKLTILVNSGEEASLEVSDPDRQENSSCEMNPEETTMDTAGSDSMSELTAIQLLASASSF